MRNDIVFTLLGAMVGGMLAPLVIKLMAAYLKYWGLVP